MFFRTYDVKKVDYPTEKYLAQLRANTFLFNLNR